MSEQTTTRHPYESKGNLVKKPELKHTNSGKLVAKGVIAVHGKSRTEGTAENPNFTSFFDVEVWGDVAKAFSELDKGDFVEIGGDFSQQRWMDTAQNKKRSAIKLIVQSFRKLERKPREEQPA